MSNTKLVLTCSVTGKSVTWYNKSIIAKKIAEAGSLELLQNNFVSREGKKVQRARAQPAVAPSTAPSTP